MLKPSSIVFQVLSPLFAFALLLTSSSFAYTHPFHLCVGQMKWNAESKVWEVSLRLHPQDLESAISKERFVDQPGKKISVDDKDFQDVALEYFSRHFFLRSSPLVMNKEEFKAILRAMPVTKTGDETPKEKSKLKWVGQEAEKGWLWIHLELSPPSIQPEREKLWFVHRLLIDSVERQENTIAIDPTTSKKFSLQFRLGEEFQEMKPSVKTVVPELKN